MTHRTLIGAALIALTSVTAVQATDAGLSDLRAEACGALDVDWTGAGDATGNRFSSGSRTALAAQADQMFPSIVKLRIITDETATSVTHADCGGTIIDSRHVLTAAHCIADDPVKRIEIITGDRDIRTDNDNRILRTARDVVCHSGYRRDLLKDDIAIIRLDEPLPRELVQMPLATLGDEPPADGDRIHAAGWRVHGADPARKHLMRKADLTVKEYRWPGHVVASSEDGRADGVCLGESGGPLMAMRGGQPTLVGVLSGVEPPSMDSATGSSYDVCGKPGYEMYFTPVAKYRKWIDEVVNHCSHNPWDCQATVDYDAAAMRYIKE